MQPCLFMSVRSRARSSTWSLGLPARRQCRHHRSRRTSLREIGFKGVATTAYGILAVATAASLTKGQWQKRSEYYTIPAGFDRARFLIWRSGTPHRPARCTTSMTCRREVTEAQNIVNQLFGGSSILSSILATNVPALDASKVTTGSFTTGLIPNLDAGKITTRIFPQSCSTSPPLQQGSSPGRSPPPTFRCWTPQDRHRLVPTSLFRLDAAKITTGLLGRARLGVGDFENLAAGSDFEGTYRGA